MRVAPLPQLPPQLLLLLLLLGALCRRTRSDTYAAATQRQAEGERELNTAIHVRKVILLCWWRDPCTCTCDC